MNSQHITNVLIFYPITDKSGLGGDEQQSAGGDSSQCSTSDLPAGREGGEVNKLVVVSVSNETLFYPCRTGKRYEKSEVKKRCLHKPLNLT